jgi:hypothetical protein
MAKTTVARLPAELLAALSQKNLRARLRRVVPLVTLDGRMRPHPMLCSCLEILAVNATTIRVVIARQGRSARNLAARKVATLIVVEPERTVYVKCRAVGVPLNVGALGRFVLKVQEVEIDAADPSEGPVRITSGITYAPAPSLRDPRVRTTLDALRRD